MTGLRKFAPLTGVLAIVLILVGFGLSGEPPDSDASTREVVAHFVEHDADNMFGAALETAGAVSLVFFVAILATAVRRADRGGTRMAAAVLAGGAVAAGGFATDAALRFAVADTAGEIEPAASQALNALWSSFFFPMIAGLVVVLLATAIASARSGIIPRWLMWATVVIVIVSFTPAGFFAAIASAIWIIVVSVLLMRRHVMDDDASASASAPAAAGV